MKRSRILVVDDEPAILRLCSAILRGEGFDITTAEDGLMGLLAYRRECAEIGLVISDLMMPRMNGIEMLRGIVDNNAGVRCLLISGYGAPKGLPSQVGAVLQKPFRPRQLIDAVNQHFDWSDGGILTCTPESQLPATVG